MLDLSIIIPAFEESAKISADIAAAAEFLNSAGLSGEIIIVDDGSEDATAEIARGVAVNGKVEVVVIRNELHRGKGFGVRTGMKASRGRYAMFADSGVNIPYKFALVGVDKIENNLCDIAHGSRKLKQSTILLAQPLHRRFISKVFRWFMLAMAGVPRRLSDTQCGFKIYKGDIARELYAACETDGFLFDIEIIMLALKKNYRIEEFPVEWTCDLDSRLSVTRSPLPILQELFQLRKRLR